MRTHGFTLIELLVVVMIVTALTAIALPSYRRAADRSKAAEVMQVLPALFEARERWVILNQCNWQGGNGTSPSCPTGTTFAFKQLDVDFSANSSSASGSNWGNYTLDTDYFTYHLSSPRTSGGKQPCVSATPKWGTFTDATIYYRGDKFSCTDNTQANSTSCDTLNVTPEAPSGNADKYRSGCI